MSKKVLFLFSIGPVQSFIEQARKTHDYYAGSRLLSHLCDKAIERLFVLDPNASLITPFKDSTNKPNRFLCELSKTDDLKGIGNDLELTVRTEFKRIGTKAFMDRGWAVPKGGKEQLNAHLEIYWVFHSFDDGNERNAFQTIESNLGAIKNVKKFTQLNESGRKCSVDGERDVKIYRLNKSDESTRKLFQQADEVQIINAENHPGFSDGLLNKGEGLSAVSFAKRTFDLTTEEVGSGRIISNEFPSTAEICIMPFEKACTSSPLNDELNRFKTSVQNDYQLFFSENFDSNKFSEVYGQALNKDTLKSQLIQLKKNASELGIKSNYRKYYALLVFDGDDMGKWLSGENSQGTKIVQDANLFDYQKNLSRLLNDFGIKAKSIVTPPSGKTIFAGGDDYIGFINIESLFKVLISLRKEFDKIVNGGLKSLYSDKEFNISFSAGVALAHYKTNLGTVIRNAYQAEKTSKKLSEKNALTLILLKNSGEVEDISLNWREITGNENTGSLCIDPQKLKEHLDLKLSNTFTKKLFESGLYLDPDNKEMRMKEIAIAIERSNASADKFTLEVSNKLNTDFNAACELIGDYTKFIKLISILQFLNRN